VNDGFLNVVTLPCSSAIFNFLKPDLNKRGNFSRAVYNCDPNNNMIQCYRICKWSF